MFPLKWALEMTKKLVTQSRPINQQVEIRLHEIFTSRVTRYGEYANYEEAHKAIEAYRNTDPHYYAEIKNLAARIVDDPQWLKSFLEDLL